MKKIALIIPVLLIATSALAARLDAPRMIYNDDNRMNLNTLGAMVYRDYTQAVAGMVNKDFLKNSGDNYKFFKQTLEDSGYPSNTAFSNEIVLPDCTGFLVAEDVLVTAGHCMMDQSYCDDFIWAFGYDNKVASKGKISKDNVYSCKRILKNAQTESKSGEEIDFAVIQLDRKAVGREPLKYRTHGSLEKGDELFMIGHPLGLPMKVTNDAVVMDNSGEWTFKASLDAFGGNSGSPVINEKTGEVEGILVSGNEDYVANYETGAYEISIWQGNDLSEDRWDFEKFECYGEAVTKITMIGLDEIIEKVIDEEDER